MNNEFPYEQCKTCKDLGDCSHPEVTLDGFSDPIPPECCPKFNEIMIKTEKKKRHGRNSA